MMVERYTCQGKDLGSFGHDPSGSVSKLESIGCQFPLGRIYAKIKFPEHGAAEEPTLHPA